MFVYFFFPHFIVQIYFAHIRIVTSTRWRTYALDFATNTCNLIDEAFLNFNSSPSSRCHLCITWITWTFDDSNLNTLHYGTRVGVTWVSTVETAVIVIRYGRQPYYAPLSSLAIGGCTTPCTCQYVTQRRKTKREEVVVVGDELLHSHSFMRHSFSPSFFFLSAKRGRNNRQQLLAVKCLFVALSPDLL